MRTWCLGWAETLATSAASWAMAAESVLRSIPRHRLRALEKEQMDALESNKATRGRLPHFAL